MTLDQFILSGFLPLKWYAWEHTIPTIAINLCNLQIVSLIYSTVFSPSNWPVEFSQEYSHFIENFIYKNGSLMQKTMETELFNKINTLAITPLPLIMKISFLPPIIDSLKDALNGKIILIPIVFYFCIRE